MLGTLRTLLAIQVAGFHLCFSLLPLGIYSVFAFYIISGYLMTLVMHESYGYSASGRRSFLLNRFLRLYPTYWAAAGVSILLIYVLGTKVVRGFHHEIAIPTDLVGVVSNVLMTFTVYFPFTSSPRLVPPTWAVSVELVYYVAICAGASRTPVRVKSWFLLSLAYVALTFAADLPWRARYAPFPAASLPFSIGAGIYFLAKDERWYAIYRGLRLSAPFAFALLTFNLLVWSLVDYRLGQVRWFEVGVYLNLACAALVIYGLARGEKIFPVPAAWDQRIGEYSYPIYLLHWQTGLLVSYLLYGVGVHEFTLRGMTCFAVCTPALFLFSSILLSAVDRPIQLWRVWIKNRHRAAAVERPVVAIDCLPFESARSESVIQPTPQLVRPRRRQAG